MHNNFNFSEFTQDDFTNLQAICLLKNQNNELPVIDLTGCDTYSHFSEAMTKLIVDENINFDSLIMHSESYFDLVQQQSLAPSAYMIFEALGLSNYIGQSIFSGKHILIANSSVFYEKQAGKPLVYNIFGLAWEENKFVPVFKVMVN